MAECGGSQTLSEVLRKTIIALCEVHVSYDRHLEVFGSIHIRADDGRAVSFMLEEVIAKLQQQSDKPSERSPKPPGDDVKTPLLPQEASTQPTLESISKAPPSENSMSDEIALMRAQYGDQHPIKQEPVHNEGFTKNDKYDSFTQFCITKIKKSGNDKQGTAYDALKSLLESNVDLDKAIGQLLQGNEKTDQGKVKVERVTPLDHNENVEKPKSETISEGFDNSFPGQGQPVFPSHEGYIYNNQLSNGILSQERTKPEPVKVEKPVPPPVPPPQFASFQGWYTLQGVGVSTPITPNHFECPFCGVILANKTNLKNHINSAHTRTKKFNCPTCNKVFYTSSAMNIHRRRNHLGLAKKYRCSLCTKMFKIKSDLSAHMLDVHNKPRKLSPKTLHRLSQKVAQHMECGPDPHA